MSGPQRAFHAGIMTLLRGISLLCRRLHLVAQRHCSNSAAGLSMLAPIRDLNILGAERRRERSRPSMHDMRRRWAETKRGMAKSLSASSNQVARKLVRARKLGRRCLTGGIASQSGIGKAADGDVNAAKFPRFFSSSARAEPKISSFLAPILSLSKPRAKGPGGEVKFR